MVVPTCVAVVGTVAQTFPAAVGVVVPVVYPHWFSPRAVFADEVPDVGLM